MIGPCPDSSPAPLAKPTEGREMSSKHPTPLGNKNHRNSPWGSAGQEGVSLLPSVEYLEDRLRLTSALDYLAKDAIPVTLRLDSKCPRARRDRRSRDRARFQRLSVIFTRGWSCRVRILSIVLASKTLGDIHPRSSLTMISAGCSLRRTGANAEPMGSDRNVISLIVTPLEKYERRRCGLLCSRREGTSRGHATRERAAQIDLL